MRRYLFLLLTIGGFAASANSQNWAVRAAVETVLVKYGVRFLSYQPGVTPPFGFMYLDNDTLKVVLSDGVHVVGSGTGGGGTMTGQQTLDSLNNATNKTFTGDWTFSSAATFDEGIVAKDPQQTGAIKVYHANDFAITISPSAPTMNYTYYLPRTSNQDTFALKNETSGMIGRRQFDTTNISSGRILIVSSALSGSKWITFDTAGFNWIHGASGTIGSVPSYTGGRAISGSGMYHSNGHLFGTLCAIRLSGDQQIPYLTLEDMGGDSVQFSLQSTHLLINGMPTARIVFNGDTVMTKTMWDSVAKLSELNDVELSSPGDGDLLEISNGYWRNANPKLMGKEFDDKGIDEVTNIASPGYDPAIGYFTVNNMPSLGMPTSGLPKPFVGTGDTIGYVALPDTGRWVQTWVDGEWGYMRDTVVAQWFLSAETDTLTTGTAVLKVEMPVTMYVTHAYLSARDTDPTDSTKVDVNYRVGTCPSCTDTTSIFETAKITILSTSYSSRTNPTQPVPKSILLDEGTFLTVDVDKGTGVKGAKLTLKGIKP